MRIPGLGPRRALIGLILIGMILMFTTASHGCTVSGSRAVSGSSPENDGSATVSGAQARILA